jgi:hypothetical protein
MCTKMFIKVKLKVKWKPFKTINIFHNICFFVYHDASLNRNFYGATIYMSEYLKNSNNGQNFWKEQKKASLWSFSRVSSVTFVPILQLFFFVLSTCINDQIQKCITINIFHNICFFVYHDASLNRNTFV